MNKGITFHVKHKHHLVQVHLPTNNNLLNLKTLHEILLQCHSINLIYDLQIPLGLKCPHLIEDQ